MEARAEYGGSMDEARKQIHRRRQGAILLLLLLGPAPISIMLWVLGTGPAAVGGVLVAVALLVALILELYRRQRRDAAECGLPVLPKLQVAAMLTIIAGISGGTFLLPNPELAMYGLACVGVVIAVVYVFGIALRPQLAELDERGVVLILGLMAAFIAMANACI